MMSIVLAHLAAIIIYKNSGVVENMTTEDLVSEETDCHFQKHRQQVVIISLAVQYHINVHAAIPMVVKYY